MLYCTVYWQWEIQLGSNNHPTAVIVDGELYVTMCSNEGV
jgi:hypothetical protein